MSGILSNNNYYNLSAQSMKLNGLDVQDEIDNLKNNNSWGNANSGSVPVSSGYFLRTNGELNQAVASNSIVENEEGINIVNSNFNVNESFKISDIVNVDITLNCNSSANFNSSLNIQSPTAFPVTMYMDGGTNDFKINNTQQSKTSFTNSSEYDFDNNLKIGMVGETKKIYLNDIQLNSVSQGMLRALNLNLLVPTVEQTYDIHWTSLTAEEQLAWKGGDPTIADPIQSVSGNHWNFQKGISNTKINWRPPIDLSFLTFQELQSVWAIVKFNNSTSVSTEGSLWFQIQAGVEPNPPYYRTRWNYCNPAIPVNQFQYYYKIFALDTITTTTTANLGKGQEADQEKFKGNPCDVEPSLWSIAFNKLVGSPTGIMSPGYTLQPVSSVSLSTASNINNINVDVVSIGINNYRWNLFYD